MIDCPACGEVFEEPEPSDMAVEEEHYMDCPGCGTPLVMSLVTYWSVEVQ